MLFKELLDAGPAEWEALVLPLAKDLLSLLPPDAQMQLNASASTLSFSWSNSPGEFDLSRHLSDVLGKSPSSWRSDSGTEIADWPGITLRLTRRIPPLSAGFAYLMASLAAPCPSCRDASFDESHGVLFSEHLAAARPVSKDHPLLLALEALGTDTAALLSAAELLPALSSSQRYEDLTPTFHSLGHLPGLLRMDASLKSTPQP